MCRENEPDDHQNKSKSTQQKKHYNTDLCYKRLHNFFFLLRIEMYQLTSCWSEDLQCDACLLCIWIWSLKILWKLSIFLTNANSRNITISLFFCVFFSPFFLKIYFRTEKKCNFKISSCFRRNMHQTEMTENINKFDILRSELIFGWNSKPRSWTIRT